MVDGSGIDGGGIEDEGYEIYRKRLDEAGWRMFVAPLDDITVHIEFNRNPENLPVGRDEATERLLLLEDEDLISRLSVGLDRNNSTGATLVLYEGPDEHDDDSLRILTDNLYGWGKELEQRQEEALSREKEVNWARRVVARLVSSTPNADEFIDEDSDEGSTRAFTTSIVLPELVSTIATDPQGAIEVLETLYAQIVKEQQNALHQTETNDAESMTKLHLLMALNRGVQRVLRLRRDAWISVSNDDTLK